MSSRIAKSEHLDDHVWFCEFYVELEMRNKRGPYHMQAVRNGLHRKNGRRSSSKCVVKICLTACKSKCFCNFSAGFVRALDQFECVPVSKCHAKNSKLNITTSVVLTNTTAISLSNSSNLCPANNVWSSCRGCEKDCTGRTVGHKT